MNIRQIKYDWNLSPQNPFQFMLQEFEKEARNPVMDVHHAIHLHIFLSGTLTGRIGSEEWTFHEGDILLQPPWELHGDNRMSAGLQILSVTADPETLINALSPCKEQLQYLLCQPQKERHRLLNRPDLQQEAADVLRRLLTLSGTNDTILNMKQWLVIQETFLCIIEHCLSDLHDLPIRNFSKFVPLLPYFASGELITAQQAAEICGLSIAYFSRSFRQIYRTPFSAYMLRLRLTRAAAKLRSGMSVKEAAASESFYDASYFTKCFTKKFGMAPGKFRISGLR